MNLDQQLVDIAVSLLYSRFPNGSGTTAAMYTDDGMVLTSVSVSSVNEGAVLCAETGAICEAVKLDKKITASVCVSRTSPQRKHVVLAPCGICQERLFLWGPNVQVAVSSPEQPSSWLCKTLKEINPYYWADVFKKYNDTN